jgi:hypothetical protein
MPHRLPDRLLPGESLRVGESLVSSDGRFRLYLEDEGYLIAYAYTPSQGIKQFWWSGVSAGPDARLEFDNIPIRGSAYFQPALILRNQDGIFVQAFYSRTPQYMTTNWENLFFVMQSDGNIVLYVRSLQQRDIVRYTFQSETYQLWNQILAVPPNTVVCKVALPPGSLILGPGAGNAEIINLSERPAAARAGSQVVSLPKSESVSFSMPGTIAISTSTYSVRDLQGPDGTRLQEGDATAEEPVRVPLPGSRVRIELGNFPGFRIRGQFGEPEFESFGELVVTSRSLQENPDDLGSADSK